MEYRKNGYCCYQKLRRYGNRIKIHEVLLVYKQIELCFYEEGNLIPIEGNKMVTIDCNFITRSNIDYSINDDDNISNFIRWY